MTVKRLHAVNFPGYSEDRAKIILEEIALDATAAMSIETGSVSYKAENLLGVPLKDRRIENRKFFTREGITRPVAEL